MIRTINFVAAILLAAAVTFGLFFLMQMLISSGDELPEQNEGVRIADITIPDMEVEIQRVQPKPDRPEEVEDVPDLPEVDVDVNAPVGEGIAMGQVSIEMDLDGGAQLGAGDAEYLPIVTVPPQYPNRALQRGIEGWCQVAFTVNENGGVEDARVIDGEPPGMFDSASLRAVARFRFNPRTRDGEPIKTHDVQYVFTYRLDE